MVDVNDSKSRSAQRVTGIQKGKQLNAVENVVALWRDEPGVATHWAHRAGTRHLDVIVMHTGTLKQTES